MSYEYYDDSSMMMAGAAGTVTMVLSLALMVFSIVCMWKLYAKAGQPGWASIVPFYNLYIYFKMTMRSGWMFLLLLIPLVNVVISLMVVFRLAKVFGKGVGYGFGILFLPIIFLPMLAFGSARYVGLPPKAA